MRETLEKKQAVAQKEMKHKRQMMDNISRACRRVCVLFFLSILNRVHSLSSRGRDPRRSSAPAADLAQVALCARGERLPRPFKRDDPKPLQTAQYEAIGSQKFSLSSHLVVSNQMLKKSDLVRDP
jgi:hypothetical protein